MNIEASTTSDAETLERLLAKRYSCRGFLAEPVADSVIERILAMAQRSPSWCNAQPWQVIVTKGEATESFRAAARWPLPIHEPLAATSRRTRALLPLARRCGHRRRD